MSRVRLVLPFALFIVLLAGCNNVTTAPDGGTPSTVDVAVTAGGPDFQLDLQGVQTDGGIFAGPFALEGRDLHYDADAHALVVDLTVTNHTRTTFPEPVTITFLNIRPEGTQVITPDDSRTLTFQFDNDDNMWTPGETSLPLKVMFGVDPGVAVGFSAMIRAGAPGDTGVIGGLVWNDLNRDGKPDPDEPGLAGVKIHLDDGSPILDYGPIPLQFRLTETDSTGHYEFTGLRSGTYRIEVYMPPENMDSTTPIDMHVLLAPADGGTSRFLDADFGFALSEVTPPGPRLVVNGDALGEFIAYRGINLASIATLPDSTMHFHWEATADPGLVIASYRYGWDLMDPDDPNDPGWAVAPGLGEECMNATHEPFAQGVHQLVIDCRDNEDHLTRAVVTIGAITR